MKKLDLELDINSLIESIKTSDYEIPKNSDVMKVILKKLMIVVLIQVVMLFFDFVMYGNEWGGFIGKVLFSCVGVLVFSFVFIFTLYQPVSMMLSINDEIKKSSLVMKLLVDKIKKYWQMLVFVNLVIGVVLLFSDDGFVIGLGGAWFSTFIISVILFQMSLSRYMTPAVVSSLSKVKELLTASPK
ncbi:protein traS [Salmonella enterica]|uniref:Protein traS n=1 Tax=Salmonella enterica subsp. houtenae serovar 48:z4,z32:- TaxID=2577535 RepID=A0A729G5F1_SALHO|nr:protein traS [Salmonella enterica subsp. houtenae]EAQ6168808.1 protein traS [Salmonella enterica]EEA9137711.1 protein traS [Salmonella enterica subsp. enterica]EKR1448417.1 protein traS [Salmonella enterica subsp. houtenae serovar 48:z4,z32:-]ECH9933556.1 protein traS [Salmonella enterica subsp. houtenae]